ncbi:MAG: peroxiredoxin family protein [Pseudomonadota bacterium]
MKKLSAALLVATTIAVAGCNTQTEQAEPSPEAETETEIIAVSDQPGPAIGDRAPVDLELANAAGNKASVASLADEKGTILVFTRSVDWCPFCQAQLKGLKDIAEDVANSGYTLAGVSYDPVSSLAAFAGDQDIPYTLLSDDGSKLIDAFAIRDPQYADPESRAYGVPYASIFILDADGVVRAKSVSADYKVRPTNDEVLQLIESVG